MANSMRLSGFGEGGSPFVRLLLFAACVALLIFGGLGGCSSKGRGGYGAIGKAPSGTFRPYTVNGKTYYPLRSSRGFSEEGLASWYGPGFHGKKTASGETYNQYAMTAAHTVLPMYSFVRVTNLGNGRSATVKINDRGPFAGNRVIDLSRAAAQKLGFIGKGTARVRIVSLDSGKDKSNAPVPLERKPQQENVGAGSIFVRLGLFSVESNAVKAKEIAMSQGYPARIERRGSVWMVSAGPWDREEEAMDARKTLRPDFPDAFIADD